MYVNYILNIIGQFLLMGCQHNPPCPTAPWFPSSRVSHTPPCGTSRGWPLPSHSSLGCQGCASVPDQTCTNILQLPGDKIVLELDREAFKRKEKTWHIFQTLASHKNSRFCTKVRPGYLNILIIVLTSPADFMILWNFKK